MTTPNKAELTVAFADNQRQISEAISRLSGTLSNKDWNEAMQAVVKLRAVQVDLEEKLKALAE